MTGRTTHVVSGFAALAIGLLLVVIGGGAVSAGAERPRIIGEHLRDTVLETPHPYAAGDGTDPWLVWSDHYDHPGAEYLVFEFAEFDLAPGDWVEVRDPAREQVHVYRGRGFKDKGGDFISKMILGSEAYIDLYSTQPHHDHYGYRIERITRGFNHDELAARDDDDTGGFEAICGTDDKEDAICYEAPFPDVYEQARSVARIVMDGSSLCTAWLVSCQNHVITNNHCTWDDDDFDTQGELDRMEFQFMYEDTTCGGGSASVEYSFMSGSWLENDRNLDYTLIQAPAGETPAATYGWLLIDNRLADIDELMYIVGHPSGRPKEISLYSTHASDQDNPDGFCEVFSQNEPPCVGGSDGELGYFCDTEGGSSGSPVLSRDTNKVIGLHHCANCPNRGVKIQPIWAMNQAGSNALPACSLFDDIGAVELDRQLYGCSDTITITVSDGSIQGAGSQAVTIESDSEPTPETVSLIESPADSGTFVGTIPTTTSAATAGDGLLSVADTDSVTVLYIDADDGQGGVNVPREAYAVIDCSGPVITEVDAIAVAGTTATIVWTTDEPANSEVFYGSSAPPWSTTVEGDLVTSHAVELGGLTECAVHDFWVRSTDEAGNTTSDDALGAYYSFETGVDVQPTYAYTGPGIPIPDNGSTISTITVLEDQPIQDLDVRIDVSHSYTADLDIYLTGPNGTQIALSTDNGGSGSDYADTVFDDEAQTSISDGSPPFTGSYRPEVPLSTFDGISVVGDWKLTVTDDAGGDTGTLNSWSITPTFPPRACGPHASYAAHAIEADVCDSGGAGDLDGAWDAGEEVTFRLTVTNDGTDPVTAVEATLTALDAGVTLIQDTVSFGDIAVGESAESQAPHLTASLAQALLCGDTLEFEVAISSGGEIWTDTFSQVVGTPIPGGGAVLDESFESGIPGDWQIVDGGGTSDTWYADSAADPAGCANTDPAPPVAGTWAAVDSDCAGSGATLDESLITPPLDLTNALTVALEFDHYYNQYQTEIADLDIRSSLTFGSWVNLARWTADTTNAQSENFDITVHAAGADDVEIRWHYYDAEFDWFWYVDNVRVSFTAVGGCETFPCGLSALPGKQTGVKWDDADTLSWDVDPLSSHGYTVYRGTKNGLPGLLHAATESCVRHTSAATGDNAVDLSSDFPTVFVGRLFWYLVTGWNAGGEGPAGDATSGPREVNASGTCP